jgi:release factor glutamine methyltransferase
MPGTQTRQHRTAYPSQVVFHDYEVSPASTNMSPIRSKTVRLVIEEITHVLSAANVPSPHADARELVSFVLKIPKNRLAAVTGITPEQLARVRALAAERATRVPVQHLTGRAPFRYLELAVGPGVFIPRPETETMVGWGLDQLADRLAGTPEPLVVDLCSGSGAIALSVAHEHPGARVVAVERLPGALSWLRRNASGAASGRSGAEPAVKQTRPIGPASSSIEIVDGDATSAETLSDLDGRVDLVLCNPPYVPSASLVAPEVADHDPAPAVFAGADGLAVIRGIVPRAAALLRPGGAVAIEHDDGHGEAVPALLRAAGFDSVEDHRDLTGRPRFATGYRVRS